MSKRNGGAAFPRPVSVTGDGFSVPSQQVPSQRGMSLRDWFAGLAMQGIMAYEGPRALDAPYSAREAYRRADAMLNERRNGSDEE